LKQWSLQGWHSSNVAVIDLASMIGLTQLELFQESFAQFARICETLGDDNAQAYRKRAKENDAYKQKLMLGLYINGVFTFLIWAIAIVNIVRAV
jgi:hypothetical protein